MYVWQCLKQCFTSATLCSNWMGGSSQSIVVIWANPTKYCWHTRLVRNSANNQAFLYMIKIHPTVPYEANLRVIKTKRQSNVSLSDKILLTHQTIKNSYKFRYIHDIIHIIIIYKKMQKMKDVHKEHSTFLQWIATQRSDRT